MYLPNAAAKVRWNQEAEGQGITLSQLVIQTMEQAFAAKAAEPEPEEILARQARVLAIQIEAWSWKTSSRCPERRAAGLAEASEVTDNPGRPA